MPSFTPILILVLIISVGLNVLWFIIKKKGEKSRESESPFLFPPLPKSMLEDLRDRKSSSIYKALMLSSQSIFNYNNSQLYLFTPQSDYLICKERYPPMRLKKSHQKISMLDGNHYLVRTVFDAKPYIITDIQYDTRIETDLLVSPDVVSLIAFPLKVGDRVEGVYLMNFMGKIDFSQDQLDSFEVISTLFLAFMTSIRGESNTKKDRSRYKDIEKRYREEIESMQQQLVLSGKLSSLGTLASGVAHEIRNPLTIVKMLVDELSKDMEGSEYGEDLSVINTEINRIAEIINQFLDFARPKDLTVIKCNINTLIRETMNFLDIELRKSEIIIKLNLYSTLPTILCDHNQIKQVFINIILNASNAIQGAEKKGWILIKTTVHLKENRKFVKIVFEDNGPGISDKIIDHLFEPFITTREQGLGLGLSITYRIIENHGGMIEAQNRMDGGARFVILLPVESN